MKKVSVNILSTKWTCLLFLVFLLLTACSEPESLTDFSVDTQDQEGFYLGVNLDSNRRIHSRLEPLNIELQYLSYFSECLLQDLEMQELASQSTSNAYHAWIHLPLEGSLNSNCPIQIQVRSRDFTLESSQLPDLDSLILWGLGDYERDMLANPIGDRDTLALDTILLQYGAYLNETFEFELDSNALPKNIFERRGVLRALLKDSNAQFELETYEAKCPVSQQNKECIVVWDTLETFHYSVRDTIDDTTFVKIRPDTLRRVFKKTCEDNSSFCKDVETWEFLDRFSKVTIDLNQYQTIFVERLKPCEEFNLIRSNSPEFNSISNDELEAFRSYSLSRELFVKDANQETCKTKNHYWGMSFHSDSLIFDQDSLEILWQKLQELEAKVNAP